LQAHLVATRQLALQLAQKAAERVLRRISNLLVTADESVENVAIASWNATAWFAEYNASVTRIVDQVPAEEISAVPAWGDPSIVFTSLHIDAQVQMLRWTGLLHLRGNESDHGHQWDQDISAASLLERHSQRLAEVLEQAELQGLQRAAWEVGRALTLLGQCFLLALLVSHLGRISERLPVSFRLFQPPPYAGACCERFRVLLWLLQELWHDQGGGLLQYVEVGVAGGDTALFLLDRLPWLDATLVDPYAEDAPYSSPVQQRSSYETLEVLIRRFPGRARLLRLPSLSAASELKRQGRQVDAVFIDGDHSYSFVRADLWGWDAAPLRPGGLLAGHDFSWEHLGVPTAVASWRAGREVVLAPDHVFFWYRESDESQQQDLEQHRCRHSSGPESAECLQLWPVMNGFSVSRNVTGA